MEPNDRPAVVLSYADPPRRKNRVKLVVLSLIGAMLVLVLVSGALWSVRMRTPARRTVVLSGPVALQVPSYASKCQRLYLALEQVETDFQTGSNPDTLRNHLATAKAEMDNLDASLNPVKRERASLFTLRSALTHFEKAEINRKTASEHTGDGLGSTFDNVSRDYIKDGSDALREARKLIDKDD